MPQVDVSIIIVSYNTKDLLNRCLKSIYKHVDKISHEIIVVDNASVDGSASFIEKNFSKVKIIKNKKNNYFTKANNQGFKAALGKYILLLAPDAYFQDSQSFKNLISYMNSHKEVGACEGLEIYENGKLIPNGSGHVTPLLDFYELSFIGKRFKNRKAVRKFRITNKDRRETFLIDVGCDAFLLIRSEIIKKIRGYDEKLFLYYTENDLCKRIQKEGYTIIHFGQAKVKHSVSVTTNKLKWKKLDIYYKDLLTYYRKHGNTLSGLSLYLLLKFEQYILRIARPNMFN